MSECCNEFELSRRGLLRGLVGAGVTTALFGSTFVQASYAAGATNRVLVVLSLRGAADGISLVVPHGDPGYYAARPKIAIPKATLLAGNDFFGLHPELAPLVPMWNAGKVAAIHATGLPAPNRSHFSAMEELESANPGSTARVGWLNRLVGRDAGGGTSRGIGLGMSTPITALYGPRATVTTATIDAVALAGADDNPRRTQSMKTTWGAAGGALGKGANAALATVEQFANVRNGSTTPANAAKYAADDLGAALAATARIIRGGLGAEVIAVDHDGGWDMHSNLGTLEWGTMRQATKSFATNLAAFFTDLGSRGNDVTVVTISEFGRRVKENANYGVDHGHGNVMFLLGGGVRGGYYGTWTPLQTGVDSEVPVTTDYRHVLAEVVNKRLGAPTGPVFPGFSASPVGIVDA